MSELLIVVEGQTDRNFIEVYCDFLCIKAEVKSCGGKHNLSSIKDIKRYDRVKIIFDADEDREKAKENILNQLNESFSEDQSKCEIFLLPNNNESGDLETLLKNIATKPHIFECFKQYTKCIGSLRKDDSNIKLPEKKSIIFAYLECFGLGKISKDSLDDKIFDMNGDYLKPLKDFLSQ